jgi:hypothetical protein
MKRLIAGGVTKKTKVAPNKTERKPIRQHIVSNFFA